jgi:hypothetical protein
MDEIVKAFTLVVAVSVAVERVTEILKQMIPGLAQERTDKNAENRRRATLQILAGVIGTGVAWQGDLQLASHTGWTVYGLIGAMSSGGSAFWNNTLDAIRAAKISKQSEATVKEVRAEEKVAVAKRQKEAEAAGLPLPPPGPRPATA